MAKKKEFLYFVCIVIFLLGIYFIYYSQCNTVESFGLEERVRCPNVLVQEGNKILLYNTKQINVPGVNPIQFNTLEEYVEFMEWQKSQNINCPVLYLQHSFDSQGGEVYKMRPSITDPQGGLNPGRAVQPQNLNPFTDPTTMNPSLLIDANHSSTDEFNKGSMPGFDGSSFYVGTTTPLDQMNQYDGGLLYSANPMDSNWGGPNYSSFVVDKGDFSGNV